MKLAIQAALTAAILSLAFATPAQANDAPTAPPAKHADCVRDKDAKAGQKDDCEARQQAASHEPQTHKMVRCNEEAGRKQLRGDERRAFMSACLRG